MTSPRKRKERHLITDKLMDSLRPKSDDAADLVAIDPGDEHVGVAFFKETDDGWYCMDAVELGYWEFIDGFESLIFDRDPVDTPPTVVVESFRLYGDKAKLQTGSEFETSQMIGIIKYIIRVNNRHAHNHSVVNQSGGMLTCELQEGMCHDPSNQPVRVDLVFQVADIKKPTAGILRKKGIRSVGKAARSENSGWGVHCVDAELHGWKHILDTLGGTAATD